VTLNQLPYEEYRGFYLARGITMPSQGISEWNVYASVMDVAAENPLHTSGSREEAMRWIGSYEVEHGHPESRLSEFASRLEPYIDDEMQASSTYSGLAAEAERLGLKEDAGWLREMAADESKHASYLRGMIVTISALGG